MNKILAVEMYCLGKKLICKLTNQKMSFDKCLKCSCFSYTTTENALIYKADKADKNIDLDKEYIAYGGDMGEDDEKNKIKIWNDICKNKILEVKRQVENQ